MSSLNTAVRPEPELKLDQSSAKTTRKPMLSAALAAMILFGILNVYLAVQNPIQFDRYQFPYKGWAWWIMQDLKGDKSPHNLAFLGSSLTVSALNSADATYYDKSVDMVYYHKTRYFDEKLTKALEANSDQNLTFDTFNLSIPGQMPSDALMTLMAMIETGHKPDVIVYGVAPRDFIDSELAGPQDTEPFTYLSRIVDISPFENEIFTGPFDKINLALQKNIYFYKFAADFQIEAGKLYQRLIDRLAPDPDKSKPFTYWDRVKLFPEYKKGEFHPYANMCAPSDLSKPMEYIDNSIEYVHRYKRMNPVAFETQMNFLGRLADFTDKNGITLVLINMPITTDNLKLLKKEYYDRYWSRLKPFGERKNTVLFDMNDHTVFKKPEDFHDGVHMNARGGLKFIDHLVESMTQSPRVKEALLLSGTKTKFDQNERQQ